MSEYLIGQTKLVLVEGDITAADTAAIVNAANSSLAGGGGVDGAIHRAGGPAIMEECRKLGGCATGQAVITTAGDLAADRVIHAVGPIYSGRPQNADLLASCYRASLSLATRHGLRSIAFPSISTGAYGYPMDAAAKVALGAVRDWLVANLDAMDQVRFVLFGAPALETYEQAARSLV